MGQAGTQYRELAFSIGCPIKTKGEQALNKSQQYAAEGRRTPFPWLLRRHSKVAAVLSVIDKGDHMTQAECLNCDELKFGSFTDGEICHRIPENDEDKAFSIALSDHYFSLEQLNEIGNKIKNGENVKLNDADKQRFMSKSVTL